MDIKEIGCNGMVWVHLGQGEDQWWFVNVVMTLRVP